MLIYRFCCCRRPSSWRVWKFGVFLPRPWTAEDLQANRSMPSAQGMAYRVSGSSPYSGSSKAISALPSLADCEMTRKCGMRREREWTQDLHRVEVQGDEYLFHRSLEFSLALLVGFLCGVDVFGVGSASEETSKGNSEENGTPGRPDEPHLLARDARRKPEQVKDGIFPVPNVTT